MSEEVKEAEEVIYLTEEEVVEVTNLRIYNDRIREEFAEIGILEAELEERKRKVQKLYHHYSFTEENVYERMRSKYGKGTINLTEGVFRPAE